MTPDMRRLALAVAKVRWHDPAPSDEEWTDEALANFECEAIVRAVLTELREVSEGMSKAGEDVLLNSYYHTSDEDAEGNRVDYQILKDSTEGHVFRAMIDTVLAEPASA